MKNNRTNKIKENEINKLQLELAKVIIDKLKLEDRLSSRRFVIDEKAKDIVKVGWSSYKAEPNINFIFSMEVPQTFALASDGDPEKLGEVLSLIYEYDKNESSVSFGEICLIDNPYLKKFGYVGGFVAPTVISNYYNALDNELVILDYLVKIRIVILVTQEEYEFNHQHK